MDLPHLRGPHERPGVERALSRQPVARADRPLDRLRPADPVRLQLGPPAGRAPRSARSACRSTRSTTSRCCSTSIPIEQINTSMTINAHRDVAAVALRRAGERARRRSQAAPGHDAERHHQGVPGARHVHLSARSTSMRLIVDMYEYCLHHDPALERVEHLLVPPAGGGGDAGAGAGLRARQRDGRARRDQGARQLQRTTSSSAASAASRSSCNAGIRFVEEMCKMRAFGEMWDEITRDRYGVRERRSTGSSATACR